MMDINDYNTRVSKLTPAQKAKITREVDKSMKELPDANEAEIRKIITYIEVSKGVEMYDLLFEPIAF